MQYVYLVSIEEIHRAFLRQGGGIYTKFWLTNDVLNLEWCKQCNQLIASSKFGSKRCLIIDCSPGAELLIAFRAFTGSLYPGTSRVAVGGVSGQEA